MLANLENYFGWFVQRGRDLFRWLAFALTTPVVFYSGWPLLAGLARELRARRPGMDTLAGGSILLAYGASTIETLRGGPQVWFMRRPPTH